MDPRPQPQDRPNRSEDPPLRLAADDDPEKRIRRLIHDLRNPLTSIQLGLEVLLEILSGHDDKFIIDQLLDDVERLNVMMAEASLESKERTARR